MGYNAGFVNISVAHFSCMEARLVLEGSDVILGFNPDSLPGATMKEKRGYLYGASAEHLTADIQKGGFDIEHDTVKLAVIPSGFILATVCEERTLVLRWSISSDALDVVRIRNMLKALVGSFKELNALSVGYPQFLTFFEEA